MEPTAAVRETVTLFQAATNRALMEIYEREASALTIFHVAWRPWAVIITGGVVLRSPVAVEVHFNFPRASYSREILPIFTPRDTQKAKQELIDRISSISYTGFRMNVSFFLTRFLDLNFHFWPRQPDYLWWSCVLMGNDNIFGDTVWAILSWTDPCHQVLCITFLHCSKIWR